MVKDIVFSLIQAMEAEKKANKVIPDHVSGMNIDQAIKVSLRALVDEGRLIAGKEISDYYVKSVTEHPHNEDA